MQENLVAELAGYLQTLHSSIFPHFGYARPNSQPYTSWEGFVSDQFKKTLDEISTLNIRIVPGFLEMASNYFEEHKHVLQAGAPT